MPEVRGLAGGRILPFNPTPRAGVGVPNGGWKARALIGDQACSPSRFIWVDDREVPVYGRQVHAATGLTRGLLVPPASMAGLRRATVSMMGEWLENK